MRKPVPPQEENAEGRGNTPSKRHSGPVIALRRSVPALGYWAGGLAAAAGTVWLMRAPAAAGLAETILALRGVEADLQVDRIDLNGVALTRLRIGPEASPSLTTGALSARLEWRSPWSPVLENVMVSDPHLRIRLDRDGIDWGALKPFVEGPGGQGDASLGAARIRGGRFDIVMPTGVLTGRFSADHPARGQAWRLTARIDPARFAGSDLNLAIADAALEARMTRTGLAGSLQITAPAVSAHGLELGDARAVVTLREDGKGGGLIDAGFTAARVRSGAAQAEGVAGKAAGTLPRGVFAGLRDAPGEVRLSASARQTRFGEAVGQAMTLTALLVRTRHGDQVEANLSVHDVRLGALRAPHVAADARFDGATGLFSDRPQTGAAKGVLTLAHASLDATARGLLARTLGGEDVPEPFGPLLVQLGAPLTDAARDFSLSLPVSAKLQPDNGELLLTGPARLRAANGVTAEWIGAPGKPEPAMRLRPMALSGAGKLLFALNGQALWRMEVQSLLAGQGGLRLQGEVTSGPPPQGPANGSVRLSDARLAIRPDGQASASFALEAAADGPMAGGRVTNAHVDVTTAASWSNAGFRLTTAAPRCLRLGWTDLTIGQTRFGPLAAGLCPDNASLVQLDGRALSGVWRSDGVRVGFSAGDGPDPVAGQLTTGDVRVSLGGSTNRPFADIALARPLLRVGRESEPAVLARAPRALLRLTLGDPAGWRLQMNAQSITAQRPEPGLALEDGRLAAVFRPQGDGLAAAIPEIQARVVDTSQPVNIATLRLTGAGVLQDNIVTADMTAATDAGRPLGTVAARHDFAGGRGEISFVSQPWRFSPGVFEPKSLAPILQGVVADASGVMRARASLAWDSGALGSAARADFEGLDFAWAGGPAVGMRGSVVFDDILKPSTPPGQTLTFAGLNPGVPLENAAVTFQLVDAATLRLEGGVAPFALGALRLEPGIWRLDRARQEVVVSIDAIDLGALIRTFRLDDMAGEGRLTGRLPLEITGARVQIVDGRIDGSADGGVFRYSGPLNRDLPDLPDPRDQLNRLASDPAWVTLKSLEEFRYDELSLRVSGDLAGDLIATGAFRGRNAKVLQGAAIRYAITLEAPVGRLLSQVQPSRGILGVTLPEGALEDAIRLQDDEANPVDGQPPQPR